MATHWQSNNVYQDVSDSGSIQKSISTVKDAGSSVNYDIPPFNINPKDVRSRINALAVDLSLKRTIFVTNGTVDGQIQITCPKEGACKIGKISVYVIGMEENLTSKKIKPRLFFSKQIILQDVNLAPSDCVYAGTPDEHGMWKAKQGRFCFDFSISFQNCRNKDTLSNIKTEIGMNGPIPSSYWHPKAGGIRYIVAGIVESKQGTDPRPSLAAYRQLFVVESVPFSLTHEFDGVQSQPTLVAEKTEIVSSGMFGLGKKGQINLKISIRTQSADGIPETGVWSAGGIGFVGVDINNESARKISNMQICLIRKIKTFSSNLMPDDLDVCGLSPVSFSKKIVAQRNFTVRKYRVDSAVEIIDTSNLDNYIWTESANGGYGNHKGVYHNDWDGVEPGDLRRMILDIDIPLYARSIRYGYLIDVSFAVVVGIQYTGGKLIEVELPVTLLHPASFLKDVPRLKIPSLQSCESLSSVVRELMQRVPSPEYSIQDEKEPEKDTEKEIPNPVFSSNVTLQEQNSIVEDIREPRRTFSLQQSRPIAKKVTLKNFKSNTLARRPPITKPSPAAIRASLNSNNLHIPSPPTTAPTILKSNNEGAKIVPAPLTSEEISFGRLSDDALGDTPRMDLDQEIDKLLACVQME